jgi:sterol desaturase/sphingolipid hydroxylase (fatty acid hydroxylase superfamily)
MGLFDFTDELIETVERWDGKVGAPSAENRKKTRLRVYKNRIIEDYFATSHPILPGVWFGPFIAYGFFLIGTTERGPLVGGGLFMLGVLAWTLLEYCLHRWPFHYQWGTSFKAKLRLFLIHGYHHEFPNDRWRLVAPPVLSWPIGLVVAGLYWLVFRGDPAWMLPFTGTLLGYLAYDWMHYYTHHGRPTLWVLKVIRRAHMVHHFKLFHMNMGISSPLWDFPFGTFAWSEGTVKEAMEEARELEKRAA